MIDTAESHALTGQEIAIIGMAGRFPGASDLDEFWRNLREGVGSISRFTEEELAAAGVSPGEFRSPGYVAASGVIEGERLFDAAFFGFSPREAAILNPQHRLFLECAWDGLERAGYATDSFAGRIGVYAAGAQNRYVLNIMSQRAVREAVGEFQVLLWNGNSIATLASYRLNLRGPSINLQTGCSASLVAVHLACQSLLLGECDMTLAGGIHVAVPQKGGYQYLPGGTMSPTGECRSFDAGARGTVPGSGMGVVVLRRLEDALADGDTIHAVIRGSAVNNDGAERAGYTVPRREGQAEVVAEALAVARVEPGEVTYVEAHGSGTEVGDPIEVAALATAFGDTGRTGYCALGSVKSNIGHLDAAAGMAGLIKTVLALKNGEIPPSLHYETPNPKIDFAHSPFFVNQVLRPWKRDGAPRRAGVSSLGMGGTNAHVVLEEAPAVELSGPGRPWELVVLSARTRADLEAATGRLAEHLRLHPEQSFADVAHTLRVGRHRFGHRRVVVCRDREDAMAVLDARDPRRVLDAARDGQERPVAFLFPGLGDQYTGMARGLYEAEPVFRREVDRGAEILRARCGVDLREVLFPREPGTGRPGATNAAPEGGIDLRRMLGGDMGEDADGSALSRTELAHPAVFVVEYALARTWMEWGVRPELMLGHSLGEYVAATVAGVFELEEALALVTERARLIAGLPGGAMLAVPLPEERVRPLLRDGLALAATNTMEMCTVSGTGEAVAALETELTGAGIPCRRLNASHAFHSPLMEPVAGALVAKVREMRLRAPEIPFLSSVTGRPITAVEATDPEYWARHLCRTVRFAEGLREVLGNPERVLLEVGPGRTLGTFALQEGGATTPVVASLRHAYTPRDDLAVLLEAAGALWMAGARLDWAGFAGGERRLRVPLPTYPFDRQEYWIEQRVRRRRRRSVRAPAVAPRPASSGDVPPVREPARADELSTLQARPDLDVRYVPPEGETQLRLAGIWEELLGFERIGAHDDFFSLGGHSLMATWLLFRVREVLGVDLPLEAVFEVPTLAGLAERVEALRAAGDGKQLPPIVPVPRAGPLPLSYAQERLWILDQMEPGSPLYNVPTAMRIRGHVNTAVAREALTEIIRRHEVLRTVYATVGGSPVQVVLPLSEAVLPVEELRDVPGEERAAVARERLGVEARQPMDLARGPVIRTRLLRFADDDHVLLITLHHIAVDGWSWGLMFQEWEALYAAIARGEPSPLPDLPVQYADYAVWQREILSGDRLDEHLAYWRESLRGVPEVLEVPTDRPHPPVQSYRGGLYGIGLGARLEEALRELGRREGATAHQIGLAAFEALLFRYTGQEDFVVGSLTANRLRPETQRLLGFFINTLPVRARLAGGLPFRGLLDRVREVMLGVHAHAELPLQKLVEEIRPERDAGRHPLVQVVFGTQTAAIHWTVSEHPTGLALSPLGDGNPVGLGDSGTSKFDLTLVLNDGSAGPATVTVEYNSDLFDRSTIRRLAEHYHLLLQGATAAPETRVADLPLLTLEEREQVLEAWNDTSGAAYPRATIPELFTEQASRAPAAAAVILGDGTLTYGELERRSNQLARLLRERGVGPEVRVGLCVESGMELVVAVLGILKAGGAYVPLDPSHPTDRLRDICSDAGVRFVLSNAGADGRVPAGLESVRLDEPATRTALASMPDSAPPVLGDPRMLAYVIYTSGSTSRPKGVAVPHGAVLRLVRDTSYFPFGPTERIAQVSNFAFDAATFEVWGALLNGGCLVLMEREAVLSPARFVAEVRERQVSAMFLTSALFNRIAQDEPEVFRTVRHVLVGGEVVDAQSMRRVLEAGGPERLLNAYGPTETTTFATWHEVRRVEHDARTVPIGRGLTNTPVYVLDGEGQPVPVGVPGELYIGGPGTARGYLGQPAPTAGKFVPDPFSPEPGARMYRSGDRVRWGAGGALELIGRMDFQVKIRGLRIEPGEIETALLGHPAVVGAVVLARDVERGERRLVAYVVPFDGADAPSAAELRSHLSRRLPEYMVPSAFVSLSVLPLTSNGKVDRKALPAPELAGASDAYVAPRTPAEEVLAGIWAEVLGVERVGALDGFFELGGHSLLATRVVSRVRAVLGVELPLRSVFETSTLAELALQVARTGAEPDWGTPVPLILTKDGAQEALARVAELSEEDLDRLLGDLSAEEEPRR